MDVIYDIIIIIWLHFIADFVLQSDYVANGKSSNNKILAGHVLLYGLPFYWFGAWFAVVNMVAHFMTDWVTSRVTSWLWQHYKRHWFFVTIGFDQAVHMTTLLMTYKYLVMN